MSEIDRDYTTDPAFSTVVLNIPPLVIDIRVILMSLKYELVNMTLGFSNKAEYRYHIIVPTLRKRFKTSVKDGYLQLSTMNKSINIPLEFEDGVISDKTIDILCACIERWNLNGPKKLV